MAEAFLVAGVLLTGASLVVWIAARRRRERIEREARENAVKASESKFRSLFDSVLEGVYQSSPEGKLLTVNPSLVRIFGYDSEEELLRVDIGRDLYENPDQRVQHLEYLNRNGESRNAELVLRRKDGSPLVVLENSRATRDAAGNLLYYEGTLTDITQHKRVQQREKDRISVLELIARNEKLDAILLAIASMIERQLAPLMASIDLLEGGRLYCSAAPSLPPGFTSSMDGLPANEPAGSAGAAAFFGRRTIAASIASDPLWEGYREIALRHNIRAAISDPILISSGRVVGTLTLYGDQAGEPTGEVLEIMDQASQLAAIAIDRRQLNDQLIFQAQHDAVTKLPNRFLFRERLAQALTGAVEARTGVALLYVDLDDFKLINDTLGHSAGDNLLCEVAARFLGCLRSTDTVARTGGDEFTAIILDLEFPEVAQEVAQKLLRALQPPFDIEGRQIRVSASIGISVFPQDGAEAEELQRQADRAMYLAKRKGKNAFERYSSAAQEPAPDRHHDAMTDEIIRKLDEIEGALNGGNSISYRRQIEPQKR